MGCYGWNYYNYDYWDASRIWRSNNNGTTWTQVLETGMSWAVDQMRGIIPWDCNEIGTSRIAMVCQNTWPYYGGIAYSDDDGANWTFHILVYPAAANIAMEYSGGDTALITCGGYGYMNDTHVAKSIFAGVAAPTSDPPNIYQYTNWTIKDSSGNADHPHAIRRSSEGVLYVVWDRYTITQSTNEGDGWFPALLPDQSVLAPYSNQGFKRGKTGDLILGKDYYLYILYTPGSDSWSAATPYHYREG
jgi:photosystem II stability/assembly factor-like uncharacterized protein